MKYRETGQACYEAYAKYLAAERGDWGFRPWESLSWAEQDAFRAGAHAVIQEGWIMAQKPRWWHKQKPRHRTGASGLLAEQALVLAQLRLAAGEHPGVSRARALAAGAVAG